MEKQAPNTAYIRGWFDRGSYVSVDSRSIVASSTSDKPARSISATLRRMGIHCTLVNRNGRYELRISTREALEIWQRLIGFSCEDKSSKLADILSSYKS